MFTPILILWVGYLKHAFNLIDTSRLPREDLVKFIISKGFKETVIKSCLLFKNLNSLGDHGKEYITCKSLIKQHTSDNLV